VKIPVLPGPCWTKAQTVIAIKPYAAQKPPQDSFQLRFGSDDPEEDEDAAFQGMNPRERRQFTLAGNYPNDNPHLIPAMDVEYTMRRSKVLNALDPTVPVLFLDQGLDGASQYLAACYTLGAKKNLANLARILGIPEGRRTFREIDKVLVALTRFIEEIQEIKASPQGTFDDTLEQKTGIPPEGGLVDRTEAILSLGEDGQDALINQRRQDYSGAEQDIVRCKRQTLEAFQEDGIRISPRLLDRLEKTCTQWH
jgi:hypothetical protein